MTSRLRSCLSSWAVSSPARNRVLSLDLLVTASTHQCNQNLSLDLLISESSCMWPYAFFTPACDGELCLVLLVSKAYYTFRPVCRQSLQSVLFAIVSHREFCMSSKPIPSPAYYQSSSLVLLFITAIFVLLATVSHLWPCLPSETIFRFVDNHKLQCHKSCLPPLAVLSQTSDCHNNLLWALLVITSSAILTADYFWLLLITSDYSYISSIACDISVSFLLLMHVF